MPVDNISALMERVPGGKYAMTRAIAERAKQLQNGALPLTEVRTPNSISVAIDEVIEGKVTFEIKQGPPPDADGKKDAEAAADAATAAAAQALGEVATEKKEVSATAEPPAADSAGTS